MRARGVAFAFLVAATSWTCGASPVFQASGGQEQEHEMPCELAGHDNPGWHACHRDGHACCPDGFSCSQDDFAPSYPGICRYRGESVPYEVGP
ncbi:MAG TPA: hypothetical protein VGG39_23330 [Polyangiaceae bacterium]